MDLSNRNVIHIKKGDTEFLQFRKLLEYKDVINHAYSLGTKLNFRTSTINKEKLPEQEYEAAIKSYKKICSSINCNYINLVKTNQEHTNCVKIVEKKIKSGKYIAYFQAFTNTYAPVEILRQKYEEAINHPDIVALSIATRPDCLGDDVLRLLDEMNKIKPVFVELGLQTIHQKSAKYIRRGYDLSVYDKAVRDLKKIGVNVVVHVILGLPNESENDMLETVKYVCESGANGIKLQLLHVIDGTDLAKDYEKGLFKTLEFDEYVNLIVKCVKIIPKDIVIHRLTGDGAKKDLIAPLWSADKKRVLNAINKALRVS